MFFTDIIGQEKFKSLLIRSVRDQKISHAQLFAGEEGYGGLPLAVAFAQFILCDNRQESESCGVCPSCLQIQKLIHPDLHFVFPVVSGKTNLKPVSDDFIEEWRNAFVEDPYLSASKWLTKIGVDNKPGLIFTPGISGSWSKNNHQFSSAACSSSICFSAKVSSGRKS